MPIPLQPGIHAPDFVLPSAEAAHGVSLAAQRGKNVVLLFFPFPCGEDLAAQLHGYQERLPGFAEQRAVVIGASNAPEDSLRQLARAKHIEFPLASDSEPAGATASLYGARSENGKDLAAVFIIDEEGLIRRVYELAPDATLPNPAMVARALNKLSDTPKPAPITGDDWRQGSREAPVILIEYSDYQCGRCAELHDLLDQVLPKYGDEVLLVHRHYLLRHSHPQAQEAAEAAEAAGAQGKFWEMHQRLFGAQQHLEREQLLKCGEEVGLDMDRFLTDLDGHRYEGVVNEKFRLAVADK
ncbi:MAG TPA: redoxin domain-containing protein, partial [Candidatus Acidoferrum sp.]|nr:redoxin domain-containing protein [Candidatus Acidoferrum sp.]